MLLVAVFLPREFSIEQKALIDGSIQQTRNLLFDMKHWPQLMAWKQYATKAQVHISDPSHTLGATVFVQTSHADIEVSITELTKSHLRYSLLINNEHRVFGRFTLLVQENKLALQHNLQGTIHSTVSGGVIVLFIRSLADEMFTSSVNNLQTQLRLVQKEMQ